MGVKDLYDGIAGYDIITGEHLSSQERTDKLLLGTGVMSFNLLLPVLSGLGVGKTIGQKFCTKADNLFRLEGVSPRILGETANELAEHTITSGIASELSAPNGYGSTADITAVSPSIAGESIEETVEAVSREGVEVIEGGSKAIINNGRISVDDINANPQAFSGKSTEQIAQMLRDSGYDVTIKNSTRSRSGAQIIQINNPGNGKNISQVQVSPSGGRHGSNSYVKISTTDQGIIKIVDGPEASYRTDGKETATIIFTGGN